MKTVSFLGALLLAAAVAPGARALDDCNAFVASGGQAVGGCRAADVSHDGQVDATDVGMVAAAIGLESLCEDLDGDGVVGLPDLVIVERYASFDERLRYILCPVCPADANGDDRVGSADLKALADVSGRDCRFDLNRDGVICPKDVELLETYLGSSTPLSEAAVRADFDGNGEVDVTDRDLLNERAGDDLALRDCRLDLNRDGWIDGSADVWSLLAAWGPCPPSPPPPGGKRPNLELTCDEGRDPDERLGSPGDS